MMRPLLLLLPIVLAACSIAEGDTPDTASSVELTGRVVDNADILDPAFERQLTGRLAELEDNTHVQLVVATTPDLQGHDIAIYSVDLARAWGIGSEEKDDGLMLLVAPNERKVRIEVGYGLEASVKDEEAGEIIEEAIVPAFERADYETGIMQAVDRLVEEVTPHQLKEAA